MKKKTIAWFLGLSVMLQTFTGVTSVGAAVPAENQTEGVQAQEAGTDISDAEKQKGDAAAADFAVRLFQESLEKGQNTMVSPLSVICALGMAGNGAREETLTQMEKVLGMSVPELNDYLHASMQSLYSGNKCKLTLANSLWFKEGKVEVDEGFLEKTAAYYDGDVYGAAFDNDTRDDINAWVSDNTDGMIEDILDEIPQDVVMYLVNALTFDGEWEKIYQENQVRSGIFTTEQDEERNVEFMHSEERNYLEDENAVGVLKYYADRRYAFAALLPDEGVSVADYVSSLTGERLAGVLESAKEITVSTSIPKFESGYKVELSDILMKMGMPDAFDPRTADLTGLGRSLDDGKLYINRVLHQTYIAVDEKGTKAGAASTVEIAAETAVRNTKEVHLNRPFVYMIIDCETNLPVFIGTAMDVGE